MLNNIHIKNFKSHADSSIALSNINLLAGMNGMGKSSVIQSLLLLRQSKEFLNNGLQLNGDLCSIGYVSDVMYKYSEKSDEIEITLSQDEKEHKYLFDAGPENIAKTFVPKKISTNYKKEIGNLDIFGGGFQYISAFRNGPQNDYDKDNLVVDVLKQISKKEGRCEFVAHYFDYFRKNIIHPDLIKNRNTSNDLKSQVDEWLKEISPNISLNVQLADKYKITYSFIRGEHLLKLNDIKAINTGFGVSYVLPVIIATLAAASKEKEPDDYNIDKSLIIIENPEAHIHPNAQAKLMELICLAAKAGVQFIIETHSDHIINSILVAVKQNVLTPEQAKIYYFDRDESIHATKVINLPVIEGGRLKNPPKGFFDQINIHMKQLMGF